jgi:hypothetical protein
MSLTSYRAAPPRDIGRQKTECGSQKVSGFGVEEGRVACALWLLRSGLWFLLSRAGLAATYSSAA